MTAFWLVLAGAIATSLLGQTLLKAGAGAPDFIAQLLDYIVALRRIPMSVAMPFTAVSYVAAVLIGHYGFGEHLSTMHIVAVATIASGVALLALA